MERPKHHKHHVHRGHLDHNWNRVFRWRLVFCAPPSWSSWPGGRFRIQFTNRDNPMGLTVHFSLRLPPTFSPDEVKARIAALHQLLAKLPFQAQTAMVRAWK